LSAHPKSANIVSSIDRRHAGAIQSLRTNAFHHLPAKLRDGAATADRRGDDRPYPHCEQEALR
jgi:hypothetical protein